MSPWLRLAVVVVWTLIILAMMAIAQSRRR